MSYKIVTRLPGLLRKGNIIQVDGKFHRVRSIVKRSGKVNGNRFIIGYGPLNRGLKTIEVPAYKWIAAKVHASSSL